MSKFCVLTNTKEFKATQEKFNLNKFTLELLLYHYYNNVINSLDTFPSDDYIKELIDPTIVTDDKKLKEFRDKNYNQEMIFDNIEDCKKKLEELRDLFSEDLIIVYTNLDGKLVVKIAEFEFKESEKSIQKRVDELFEKIRNLKVPVRNKLTNVFDKAWLKDSKQFKNFRHAFDTAKIDKALRDRIIEGIKLNPDMFDGKTFDDIIEILTSGLNDNLKDIYNKSLEKQVDTALEQHLMNFLKRYNIISKEASPEEIIAELKETYKDRDFSGFGLGAFDVLNKIIYLSNNRNKITAPEEFAHAFVELMGALKNEDFLFLNREVSKTDIYKQVFEQYKDTYVRKDGKPNLLMIRKEAIGLALAAAIVDRWDAQNADEETVNKNKSFFKKLIDWLEKILDLFKGAKRISFNQLVTSIATDVLNNDHTRLENYGNENFAKQEYQRTLDANPLALKYMQKMSEFGNVMTGSISVRYQGELYREGEDDLHDIDMIVPQSAHGVNLHSFVVRQTALNTRKANPILLEYVKNLDYFKKVLAEFPDMELAGAYPNNYKRFEYITVNAVMSKDHDLTRRFIQMSGSYADRLKNFTKEEQDLIYLFDFFLKEGEVRTVKDEKNKLNLAHFEESFTAKLIDMGRPKDVFDYQKWKAYKTATKANRGQIFFQSFKPGIEITPNRMQQVALEEMTDYIESRINGRNVPPFFLLNGMAGTGKTTIINMLLKSFVDKGEPISAVVGAVANKAKQNIFYKLDKDVIRGARVKKSSISGILAKASSLKEGQSGTTHQRVDDNQYGSVMKNRRGPRNIIIIDECSMIEDKDFDDLLKMAEKLNVTMIFVGDSGQLPLIEENNPNNKQNTAKVNSKISKTFLLASDEATVTLTERVRLGEGNPILDASELFYVTPQDAQRMDANGDMNLEDLETKVTDEGAFIAKKSVHFNYERDVADLFRQAFREGNTSLVKYVCDTNRNVHDMNTKVRKSIFGLNYTVDFKDKDIVMLKEQHVAINRYGQPDLLDNSTEGIVLHHRVLRLDEDKYEGYCCPFILFCKKLNEWVDKNGTNFPLVEEQIDPELMKLWRGFSQLWGREVSPIRDMPITKMNGDVQIVKHNIFEDVYTYSKRLKGKIKPVRTVELTLLAQGENANEPEEYKAYAVHPEDWNIQEENMKIIYANTGKSNNNTQEHTDFVKSIAAQILHSYYAGRKQPSKKLIKFLGAKLVNSYKDSRMILQYGYAITSHKSLGSTYDVTIIDGDAIANANWGLADRKRMMYTAITRSSNITMVITDLTWDTTETEPLDKLNDRINKNRGKAKIDVAADTYKLEPEEKPVLTTKTVQDASKTIKLDGKDIEIEYQQVNQPSEKLPEVLNGKIMSYANSREDIIRLLFSNPDYTNIINTLSQMGFTRQYIEGLLDSDAVANDLMLVKQYIDTVYNVEQLQDNIEVVRERSLRDALMYIAKQLGKNLPELTPMAKAVHRLTTITAFNKQHITFDKNTHKYYYDGQPNDYSVTEFIEAKNLNFDLSRIQAEKKRRETSKAANGGAAVGNAADDQLRAMFAGTFRAEDFNTNPRITKEVKEVYKQIKARLDLLFPGGYYVETNEDALRLFGKILLLKSEGRYIEKTIAGTMDMLVVDSEGKTWLFDFKTHKANNEDEITNDFGTKDRYDALTSWYADMCEATNGINIEGRNLLQINYLSDLTGNTSNPIEVTLEDDDYVIKDTKISGNIDVVSGPTNIHFHDVVYTPKVLTTSQTVLSIKGMSNSITRLAQAQRKSPANLFDQIAARERLVNQQNINPLATIVPESPAIGENISSRGSEFAKKLTNPGNNISIEFRGRTFKNAEHAYQTWKSGEFDEVAYNNGDQFKPKGSKPVNKNISFDLMVEILTAKLLQHPDLVQGINDRGGLQYLQNSTHNVVGDEYWEKQGKFIEALQKAYQNVNSSLEISTEDYDKQTKDGSTTLKARKFYIKGREDAGYFEITTTNTTNVYSVHFKTTSKDALNEDEKQALFSKLASSFPEGAIVSTYGEISRGGIAGLNRFKNLGFTQVSVRTIRHKEGGYTTIPVFVKNTLGKTLPTIMPAGTQFTRDSVENDTKSLYIFTDNTDRDSGSKLIEPDSWYAQTYGQGHHYPTKTSSVLRGLDNARPISTLRWYNNEKKGKTGRWTDADFEEFKQVVDKEFYDILEAWRSGKYDRIVLPSDSGLKDGLINGDISNITYERTPKLFDYLHDKMDQLVKNIVTQQISTIGTVRYIQSKGGYGRRTDENAEWSDVTVAIAADFTTAGEERTKRAAEPEGKYVAEDISHYKNLNASDGQYFAHRLATAHRWKERYPDGIKLNIAGNGIYTLAKYGITLEQVDSYMDGFVAGLRQIGVKIKELRSGGQTGLDEAGIKAGLVNGVPVSINAPKDYAFRDINGIDIRDEQQFKARFDNYSRPNRYNTATPTEPEQPFTPINDKYVNSQLQLEENLIDYSQLNNPFVVQRSNVNSIDSIANGEYTISFDIAINDNNNAKLDTKQKQKETLKVFLDLTVANLPIGARITVDTGDDLLDIELWGILNKHHRLFVDTTDPTDISIDLRQREDAKLITAAKKAGLMSKDARLVDRVTLYPFTYARSYNEMKWSQQYNELNAKVPGKRLKALAVSAVYKISELVTMIQEGGNEDLFPTEYREKVRELKGADRATILSSQDGIGITGLANVVKEAFFNINAPEEIRNTNLDKLNRKKTKEIVAIYDNFESFIRFGYAKLQALEGITVNETAVTDPRVVELFDGEEEMNIQEVYGSSLEHWQVGFRSVSATMSLSQMIKEKLNKFYELDENDDIIYDEWGFEKRINATQAVSTMLSWFIGTETVEDMVSVLESKVEEHPWVLQLINNDPDLLDTTGRPIGLGLLITEDKDGNHVPENEEFRSKFFNNMHLYFTKYGIIKKNGDIAIVNDKNVISAIANDALVIAENNPDNFKDGILVGKAKEGELPTTVDKILVLRKVLNEASKKKELLVDDELAEQIEELFGLLGITLFTTDLIKAIINTNPSHLEKIVLATSPGKGILNLFLSYNRDNKEIDKNFRDKYIKDIQNIVKPFQDFILDKAEAVTYQDGKLYYSYVLPSYLSEFNTKMKNSTEFINNEFKSEFFGLTKEGKKQWLNEWLRQLAENEKARKDFDHKVVLAANGKSYIKKTPKEYATSMLNEYFYDKTKRLAWYRIPMMSNKPSEEYIRFTRYTTGYKDTIRNLLVNTAIQEIIRIADVIDRAERIENGLLASEDKIKFYDINVGYIDNAEDRHSKKELLNLGITLNAGTRFVILDYLQPFLNEALKERKSTDKEYTGLGKQLLDIILGQTATNMTSSDLMFLGTTLDLLKRAIDYGMDRHFAEFLSVMESEGVITTDKNGKYTTEVGKLGSTDKQIRENLEEFFWNDTYASLSIMQMYITDPIYYGNAEELQKRLAQLHAPGSRLNITAQDKNGNRYSDGIYRTLRLKDDKIISEVIDKVGITFDKLIEQNRNNAGHVAYYRQQKDFIIKELKKVNVTDAQTFCTPTAMRKKLGMLGEWNDAREKAYQRLASDTAGKSDYDILMLPLKPFLFSQQLVLDNNGLIKTRRVGVQIKTSEYLLVLADAITRTEGEPTKLSVIFDVIEESLTDKVNGLLIPNGKGIDAISFESSIKTGLKAPVNLNNLSNEDVATTLRKAIYAGSNGTNKTNLYNLTFVDELDFKDYSIQQAVPTHFFGTQQLGSQSKALIFADMDEFERDENGAYKLDDEGKKIPRKIYIKDELGRRVETTVTEAKKEYFDLLALSIEKSCEKLVKELNLDTADVRLLNIAISRLLKKLILNDARFGSDLLWAVDINNNGDFNLPLSDPTHSTRIQQLLFSIIKDRVYKQKIHGGPVVQVSNWGNENLHIRYTNSDGETLLTELEFTEAQRKLKSTTDPNMSDNEKRAIIASVLNKLSKFAPVRVAGKSLNTYKQYVDYHTHGGGIYYECFAPIYDRRLLDYEDEDGNIDIEAIRREEPQLLELIGYRIPTEAKYSMASLRIVGFLPREAGEGIMLPKEWTAISGSDFDVDKLYIMRRSFERITNKDKNLWEKGRNEIDKINDRIFDIMLGVLESEQAKSKVLKIGTFDPLKVVGYKLAALREQVQLAKLNVEDKNNINYNSLGISYDNLSNNIDDLKDLAIKGKNLAYNHIHLLFFKQNMVAGKLIGVFAQSNISHAYLSMYAISQGYENGIKINGLRFRDFKLFDHNISTDKFYIDPIYGFDGTPISDNIAAFLAASVDAVKDPILNLMNVNMKTVNAAMILARMGFNIEQIGLLFGLDVVTKVILRMDKLDETFEEAIKAELEALKNAIDKNPDLLNVQFNLDLNDRELKDNLVKPSLLIDFTILSMLLLVHSIAEATRSIIHMTRFNSISSAKGPDIMNAIIERLKTNTFWEGLGDYKKLNNALVDAVNNAVLAITRLRSDYFEDVIFGDRFILAKPHFESAFIRYIALTGLDINNIRKKEANKFANFYVDYMINKVYNLFDFSYEHRMQVMTEYPKLILAAKSDERWLDNKFVLAIQQRQDEKDLYVGIDINLRNLESDDIEDIKADFDEFADEDPETLQKIIEYMFNRGGFGFNPKTFTSLITNYIKLKYMGRYLDNVRLLEVADDNSLVDEFGEPILFNMEGEHDVTDIVYQFLLHLDRKFPKFTIKKAKSIKLKEGLTTKSLQVGDRFAVNYKMQPGIYSLHMPNTEGEGTVIKLVKVDSVEEGVTGISGNVTYLTVVERLGGGGQGIELNTRKEGIKSIYKKNKELKTGNEEVPPAPYPDDPGPDFDTTTDEEVDSADNNDGNWDSLMDSINQEAQRNPRNKTNLGSGYVAIKNDVAAEGSYLAEMLKANSLLPVAQAMLDDTLDIEALLMKAASREKETGQTSVNPTIQLAKADLKALGLTDEQLANSDKNYDLRYQC